MKAAKAELFKLRGAGGDINYRLSVRQKTIRFYDAQGKTIEAPSQIEELTLIMENFDQNNDRIIQDAIKKDRESPTGGSTLKISTIDQPEKDK